MNTTAKPQRSIFIAWEDLLPHLHQQIIEAAPEVKGKSLPMLLRARKNGFWMEFYKDEATLHRRQAQPTMDGPEIIAGLLDL